MKFAGRFIIREWCEGRGRELLSPFPPSLPLLLIIFLTRIGKRGEGRKAKVKLLILASLSSIHIAMIHIYGMLQFCRERDSSPTFLFCVLVVISYDVTPLFPNSAFYLRQA